MSSDEALREENRALRAENDVLKTELSVLRAQAKTDAAELTALREKVRRLNNESFAQKAAVLSRSSPPPHPEKEKTSGKASAREAPVAPLTVVGVDEVREKDFFLSFFFFFFLCFVGGARRGEQQVSKRRFFSPFRQKGNCFSNQSSQCLRRQGCKAGTKKRCSECSSCCRWPSCVCCSAERCYITHRIEKWSSPCHHKHKAKSLRGDGWIWNDWHCQQSKQLCNAAKCCRNSRQRVSTQRSRDGIVSNHEPRWKRRV